MGMLQDKVAVIIGAAGRDNMGQVIARRFAAEGARVVVAGRDDAALAELAEEIGGLAVRCDLTAGGDHADLADCAVWPFEIGRGVWRERGWQDVWIKGGGVP